MDRIKEWLAQFTGQIMIGLGIVIVILTGMIFFLMGNQADNANLVPPINREQMVKKTPPAKQTNAVKKDNTNFGKKYVQIYIDVKGAVKHPGVYQVNDNMRVNDAINLAGGFNRSADKKQVNLAQKLTDQQVVYIPIRGEVAKTTPSVPSNYQGSVSSDNNDEGSEGFNSSDEGGKINLNTADVTKLQELNGIGEKKAEQIISYRKSHGNFKTVDDLKEVPGFGDKTVANLKSQVTV